MKKMANENYRCEEITTNTVISDNQYKEISGLIYDTDPYIYPALFGNGEAGRRNSQIVLPVLFEEDKDTMFKKTNLFLLYSGSSVVGVLLWKKGTMAWNADCLLDAAEKYRIELNKENVMKVSREYIDDRYTDSDLGEGNIISLINVCISNAERGRGLGQQILSRFIALHENEQMHLCVLADNPGAIRLYSNNGFQIVGSYKGFSLENNKPTAFEMERR